MKIKMKESKVSTRELSQRVTEAWMGMLGAGQYRRYAEIDGKVVTALMEQVKSGAQSPEGKEEIFRYLKAVVDFIGE